MTASTAPIASSRRHPSPSSSTSLRHGRRHAAYTAAALATRSQATPSGWTRAKRRTANAGVIAGYRAEVDPKAVGFPIAALVRISPEARQLHRIPEVARETPEVVECYRITGEDCFFLKL